MVEWMDGWIWLVEGKKERERKKKQKKLLEVFFYIKYVQQAFSHVEWKQVERKRDVFCEEGKKIPFHKHIMFPFHWCFFDYTTTREIYEGY